jgi:hypothetical protein
MSGDGLGSHSLEQPAETRYYSFMCGPKSIVGLSLFPPTAAGSGIEDALAHLEFPVSAMLPSGESKFRLVDMWLKDWYTPTRLRAAESGPGGSGPA